MIHPSHQIVVMGPYQWLALETKRLIAFSPDVTNKKSKKAEKYT